MPLADTRVWLLCLPAPPPHTSELHNRVSGFMLRRTQQETLSKHLPPLLVHTLFCQPSALQVRLYCLCFCNHCWAVLLQQVGLLPQQSRTVVLIHTMAQHIHDLNRVDSCYSTAKCLHGDERLRQQASCGTTGIYANPCSSQT